MIGHKKKPWFVYTAAWAAALVFAAAVPAISESNGVAWIVESVTPTPEPFITDMAGFDDLQGEAASDQPASDSQWMFPFPRSVLYQNILRLVNTSNLLDASYVPNDLIRISVRKTSSSAILMQREASEALDALFAEALADGVTLYAHSGYRSYQTQKSMYNNRLSRNKGVDDGYVAKPGASDHQTGLGVDIISKEWIGKPFNGAFANTKEAAWLKAHCADYGFILRYPEGKEAITQIPFEPWHMRYVGTDAARYIMNEDLTLEEFDALWREHVAAIGGSVSGEPLRVYQTDIKGPDGDHELSLFSQGD